MHRQRLLKAQLRDYDRGRRVLLSRLKAVKVNIKAIILQL